MWQDIKLALSTVMALLVLWTLTLAFGSPLNWGMLFMAYLFALITAVLWIDRRRPPRWVPLLVAPLSLLMFWAATLPFSEPDRFPRECGDRSSSCLLEQWAYDLGRPFLVSAMWIAMGIGILGVILYRVFQPVTPASSETQGGLSGSGPGS